MIAHRGTSPEAADVHVTTDWSDEEFGELRIGSARPVKPITGPMKIWRDSLRVFQGLKSV